MQYEIKNRQELVEVNFTGHMLRQYGLRSGDQVNTELGSGKAHAISHVYYNINSFEYNRGQVQHLICVDLGDGSLVRVPVTDWMRVSEREFTRWCETREMGRRMARIGIAWDEHNVAEVYNG